MSLRVNKNIHADFQLLDVITQETPKIPYDKPNDQITKNLKNSYVPQEERPRTLLMLWALQWQGISYVKYAEINLEIN